VHSYVQKAVVLRKKALTSGKLGEEGSSRCVFLEQLAKAGCSERKIQDELLNIFLPRRDTTASLLSYLFYYLARRTDVFTKLRAEVVALGTDRLTFEQIKCLKYPQCCKNIPSIPPNLVIP
jgi:cytochrome P450